MHTGEEPMERTLTQVPGVSVLRVEGVDTEGRPLVQPEGREAPCSADVVWMKAAPAWDRCTGLRVLVAFPDGEDGEPVVLGLLDAPPHAGDPGQKKKEKEKRVRIEGKEEVVIECGKSKISLRSDGRIEIRGGHLISRSSGPNKVKGATVHIN